MKIIISGYGRMGREVEKAAGKMGHEIAATIDNAEGWDALDGKNQKADVVIDFSQPDAVTNILERCFHRQLPVVTGTTGWYDDLSRMKEICHQLDGTLFYAPNFSLGVNLFYLASRFLAKTMAVFENYKVQIKETHHVHKLDAPSGTAIKTAEDIIVLHPHYHSWTKGDPDRPGELVIISSRTGEVPGTHTVTYTSDADLIELKHEAKNRSGFAAGAVQAAEWVREKKGIFTMDDMIKSML
ncbi:MAG: 4-hydroxy-tetrahydrodipicolinate reductase [bacterium]